MEVELWALQPNWSLDHVGLIAKAGRVCHDSQGSDDAEFLGKLIEWKHTSVLEHAIYTLSSDVLDIVDIKELSLEARYNGIVYTKEEGNAIVSFNGRWLSDRAGLSPNGFTDTTNSGSVRRLNLEDLGEKDSLYHGCATFYVSGISRACSHQIVRHRIGSYSQQSMRYCDVSANGVVVPKSIGENALWHAATHQAVESYKALVANGVPKEDARMLLPIATKTNVVVTMPFISLLNFFDLRISRHAQWEIYEVAEKMLALLLENNVRTVELWHAENRK